MIGILDLKGHRRAVELTAWTGEGVEKEWNLRLLRESMASFSLKGHR